MHNRLRKELKIRPGYTPEEDIKRFRSTRMAEQDARAATKGVVPGAKTTTTTKQPAVAMSKAQKKNFKRKEKRRGEEEVGGEESGEEGERKGKEEEEEVPESWDDGDEEEVPAAPAAVPEPEPVVVATAPVDDEKRLKALRKKLRQVRWSLSLSLSSGSRHAFFELNLLYSYYRLSNSGNETSRHSARPRRSRWRGLLGWKRRLPSCL